MRDISSVTSRVDELKELYAHRDTETGKLRALRQGDWEQLAPGAFTEDYPAPMVANRIDVMARDTAASLTPLPTISCNAAGGSTEAKKRAAEMRTKIANHYVGASNLKAHMTDAADGYNYYGMLAFFIDPDLDREIPTIQVRGGGDIYAVWNVFGDTTMAAEEWEASPLALREAYPRLEAEIKHRAGQRTTPQTKLSVIRFADQKRTTVYVPDLGNLVLADYETPIPGRCQYVCVPRPSGTGSSFESVPRGAYVDLIYPQLARHEFNLLSLDAAYKSVQSPVVVPQDVTSVPYGPDAVIPTQNPAGVGRLAMNVPPEAFRAMASLDEDLAIGGMSPEARTGNIQASVITGKGIEAATAGYSSQIANAQTMIAFGLELAIKRCFMMDEHLWRNKRREVRGIENGIPFAETYVPSKDIKGDHSVEISYGFLLGMAPNNALVFLLQASAAGLVSKDFAARQLPVGVNPTEEQRKIELEALRNSIVQSLAGLGTSIPQFVLNQQDPTPIIKALAETSRRIQKGEPIEEIIEKVFIPEPPPEQPTLPAGPESAGPEAGGGPASLANMAERGAMPSKGPGDRPDLAQFFAGMSSAGNPVLQGGVSRMDPIAG